MSSQRRPELDAMRGVMLVWIALTHLPTAASAYVNQPFGFVGAAEGFIFLSALFTGRIYFHMADHDGYGTMMRKLWARTVRLYGYHALLLGFAFLVAVPIASHGDRPGLHNLLDFYFMAGPKQAITEAALLIYRPPLLDILPMYIIFLAETSLVILLAGRIGWRPILWISFAIWMLAQFGFRAAEHNFVMRYIPTRIPLNEMGSFDLWAWQFLWFLRTKWSQIAPRVSTQLPRDRCYWISFAGLTEFAGRKHDTTVMRIRRVFWLLFLLASSCLATTRHYYIAAEEVMWDYAPSGRDLLGGRGIPQPWGGHTQWHKTRYIEYTDDSFTVRKPQPEWLGIMGPVIRAEVGDEVVVEFLNRSKTPHSMHPHGLRYDKASEGSFYLPWGGGARVLYNHRFTYHWFADAGSGPGPGELSSVVWWYHGHVDEPRETNAGLLGAIIVTAKGMSRPDGTPKDVDREFVTSFMIFDELAGKNEGQFHAINGLIFGNLQGLVMKQGEKVRWYVMAMGNEKDLHTPHWHGKTLSDGRRNLDVVELLPAGTTTVDMLADNPGVWLFHCHVEDHMEAGMMTSFTIYQSPQRDCPFEFTEGKFWGEGTAYSLSVKNASQKKIRSFVVKYDHLLGPGNLAAPFDNEWASTGPLEAGGKQTVTMKPYLPGVGEAILAWAVAPLRVVYVDGTTWTPQQPNECFQLFWRDKDHEDLVVLPPEQVEMQED